MTACAAFGPDGPETLAELLRTIDRLTVDAAAYPFARLFGVHPAFGTALTLMLTLHMGLMAVNLFAGRATLGMSALTPRLLGLGIVLSFAIFWLAYQDFVWKLLVGAPDQIAASLLGTHGSATIAFAARLDMLFGALADAAQSASVAASKNQMVGSVDIVWLGALLLLAGTVGALVVAKIALAALLAFGPLFIVLCLFGGTRGVFAVWLKASVMVATVPLFVSLIGGGLLALLAPLMAKLELADGAPSLGMAATFFLTATAYCVLMALLVDAAAVFVSGWRLPLTGNLHGGEGAASYGVKGDHIVIDTAPPALVLRSGKEGGTLVNVHLAAAPPPGVAER